MVADDGLRPRAVDVDADDPTALPRPSPSPASTSTSAQHPPPQNPESLQPIWQSNKPHPASSQSFSGFDRIVGSGAGRCVRPVLGIVQWPLPNPFHPASAPGSSSYKTGYPIPIPLGSFGEIKIKRNVTHLYPTITHKSHTPMFKLPPAARPS